MAIVKPEMQALELISKTREYLDYIERHIKNVAQAWLEIQDKCKGMRFIYDDYVFHTLNKEVELHDVSKLSEHEFIQYRKSFFPTSSEPKVRLVEAWEHHKKNNHHHWETWTSEKCRNPYFEEIHCAHMVIDWLAMSYEFGGTPREYYEANKERIEIPKWAILFITEIFDCLDAQ